MPLALAALCACSGSESKVPVDPVQSTASATPSIAPDDGATPVQLIAVAKDATGAPLSGRTVVFSAAFSGATLSGPATTDATGTASATLTSTTAGSYPVTAQVDGVALNATPFVTFVDVSHVAVGATASTLPDTWKLGPFMEIYVRGYKDSNGDGIGDFKGLTQSLDYLKQLGVTGLWLMPVNDSQDHDHGYAVTNYRGLEASYGSLADFDELVAQAHSRGIGVIIDYVMNHSAAQNPLFTGSAGATSGPFRDWYVWSASHPSGWSAYSGDPWKAASTGWYYAVFWDQMPDFNLLKPAVIDYHHDNLRYWLNRGVDGFRFDAVGTFVENGASQWVDQPQNYQIMSEVKALAAGYSNRYLVCEDPDGYPTAAAACGGAFAFQGHNTALVRAATGDTSSVLTLATSFPGATPQEALRSATFLANHDSFTGGRLYNQLGGSVSAMKMAAAGLLTLPGTPFLYYGEEIGLSAASTLSGDPSIRTPMSWSASSTTAGFTTGAPFRALASNAATFNVAAEQGQPDSLLNWYKQLIKLRTSHPSLAQGSYEGRVTSGLVLGFRRTLGSEHSVVVLNYGTTAGAVSINGLPAGAALTAQLPSGGAGLVADGSGNLSIPVGAQTALVYTY